MTKPIRFVAAIFATLSVALLGAQPILAAATFNPIRPERVPSPSSRPQLNRTSIQSLKDQLQHATSWAQAKHMDHFLAQFQRVQVLLDIASAPDSDTRHRLIAGLGVTIQHDGGVTEFIQNGKVRLRVPTPSRIPSIAHFKNPVADSVERPDGGATVAAGVGGRQDVCYDDDGTPDTCATVQDGEDAIALAVSMDSDLNDAQAEADDACAQVGCLAQEPELSGPWSPDDCSHNCVVEVAGAIADVGLGFAARWGLYSLGTTISASLAEGAAVVATGTVALTVLAATAGVAAAVFSAYAAYKCVYQIEPTLADETSEAVNFGSVPTNVKTWG
jgi:hypothetical protein